MKTAFSLTPLLLLFFTACSSALPGDPSGGGPSPLDSTRGPSEKGSAECTKPLPWQNPGSGSFEAGGPSGKVCVNVDQLVDSTHLLVESGTTDLLRIYTEKPAKPRVYSFDNRDYSVVRDEDIPSAFRAEYLAASPEEQLETRRRWMAITLLSLERFPRIDYRAPDGSRFSIDDHETTHMAGSVEIVSGGTSSGQDFAYKLDLTIEKGSFKQRIKGTITARRIVE